MAKKKISELPAGGALNGTELVPIVQTGTTKRITAQDIANLGNASGVEGSGTINRLAKFTATSTIGNSQLFDDGTSVGLGTITPLGLLHLFKASAATRMVIDGNAGQNKIITYRTNAVQRFGLYVNNTAESGSNAGSDFAIRAYSDAGTLLSTPLFIKRSTGAATFASSVSIDAAAGGGSTFLKFNNAGTAVGIIGSDGAIGGGSASDMSIFTYGANNMKFWTNGNTRLTINSAGNVGIGTTSPQEKLQVQGNLRFTGNDIITANTLVSEINSYAGSTNQFKTTSIKLFTGTYVDQGFMTFNTSISGADVERMRIAESGNVGIGTTNPLNKFVISNGGAQGLEIGADATYNVNLAAYNRSSPGYIPFQLDASKISFLTGNVLIGTTTDAGYKLDVNGTARVTGIITANALTTKTADGSYAWLLKDTADNLKWEIGHYNNDLYFYSYGSSNIPFIINDTSGAATFSSSVTAGDIIQTSYGTARIQVTSTTNGTNSAVRFTAKNSSGDAKNAGLYFVSGTSSENTFLSLVADDNNYQFNVLANGQVAINTTTPDASAKVQIDSNTQGFLVPRMTETEINAISSPAEGLLVYNTDQHKMCLYDGSGWHKLNMSPM